jgi:hypothetical protein
VARDKVAEAIIEREKALRSARSTWESLWQSIAKYCLPNSATFTEQVSPGLERTRWILDSTAPRALEMFASFLHTLLNNPASQWVRLGVEGEAELEISASVRAYMEACQRKIMSALTSPSADIYSQLHQIYLDLGAFGTGVMFEDVVNKRLRCRVYHLDDCVISEGEDENIDSVFRQRHFTRRQALQRWGEDKLGREFASKDSKKLDENVRFIHAVFPATDPISMDLPKRQTLKGAPFYACWILDGQEKKVVEYASYEEFPYFCPRWYKSRSETYGRSQAMTALPDIRMVNRMSDTILRGAEKIVDPPLVIPDGSLVSPVRVHPGGLTFTEGQIDIKTLIPPGTSRIETGQVLLEQRQTAIKEAFFTPLFVTPDSPVKTATQVLQEVDERNRALSPMLVRLQTELFSRLVTRTFNLLNRAGLLPRPPAELAGKALKLEYVSPLIASQKQMEGLAMVRTFEMMAMWAQVDKGIFDWVDTDGVAQRIPMANGVPAELVKTKTQVLEVRKARQAAEAQQAAMAASIEGGKTAAALITAGAKREQVQNAA